MDLYSFYKGEEFEAYSFLGAHMLTNGPDQDAVCCRSDEACSTIFRTFAPSASAVSVIGEWNGWQEIPMYRILDGSIWECRIEGTMPYQMYKYRIYNSDNSRHFMDHCDPYAFYAELRPGTASRLCPRGDYLFHDSDWLRCRSLGLAPVPDPASEPDISRDSYGSPDPQPGGSCGYGSRNIPAAANTHTTLRTPGAAASRIPCAHLPMNIYELHAGSWKVPNPSEPWNHYDWRELADLLVPYLLDHHYNYLELMPVTEYPSDESWGYQTTGFFAPTSRYGTPDGLKYLIDLCHANGIGVILDFVAVHFSSNDYALLRYDGTALFEYPDSGMAFSEWGTCNFMHSRGEVGSFLKSAAHYWIKEFHFDGLRVDAVRNLIYYQGDENRGINHSAIEFIRSFNSGLKQRFPGILLIAEDSSAYPGVTRPISEGGLGFDYKWDLGWMHDTLSFLQAYPGDRRNIYHRITFSIYYYYNERYLLPLSHDEVVHGKATIVQRMNGSDLADKLAQARVLYTYMYAHPGKKLNFMGNELGGLWEWTEKKDLDWWLVRDRREHREFYDFMQELTTLYSSFPALWSNDYDRDGFEWADIGNEGHCAIYSFIRRGGGQSILAVFNFDSIDVHSYQVTLPERDLAASTENYTEDICFLTARTGTSASGSGIPGTGTGTAPGSGTPGTGTGTAPGSCTSVAGTGTGAAYSHWSLRAPGASRLPDTCTPIPITPGTRCPDPATGHICILRKIFDSRFPHCSSDLSTPPEEAEAKAAASATGSYLTAGTDGRIVLDLPRFCAQLYLICR